jgi:Uma2 family endonuclease
MSVLAIPQPFITAAPTVALPLKRFTTDEVQQLDDAGLFVGQRYELIDGELIDKMGQNRPHARAIRRCATQLRKVFGEDRVEVQAPVLAGLSDQKYSLPEPDVAVREGDDSDPHDRHPTGPELTLLLEVSDSSLRQDTVTKRGIYARSGVPEYWVLDVTGRRLLVHRDVRETDSRYGSLTIYGEDEAVTIASQQILVSDLLP